MKAIVLCAGYGKRLQPYTETYQKTMLPVHNKPLLEYIIEGLIYVGFKDIILVVGYLKEQIMNYFQDGRKLGINLEYIHQKVLNGTGGALLLCEPLIKKKYFFLTWGDILVPYQVYKHVYEIYKKEKQDFFLVANYTEDPYKGAAIYMDQYYCTQIIEKPNKGTSQSNYNNCGIFILSKEIFKVLKTLTSSIRGEIEIPRAINLGITKNNWRVRVIKMNKNQFRADFGNKNQYERLKEDSSWLKFLKN